MATTPLTIHLIQHSHTDLGYTKAQDRVERDYATFLGEAARLAKVNARRSPAARFRYTIETAWQAEVALAHDPALPRVLAPLAKRGLIEIGGSWANLTDLPSDGEVALALERAAGVRRRARLKAAAALAIDINGWAWSTPARLAEHGLGLLIVGMNGDSAILPFPAHTPLWWEGPDGTRLLVYFGDHYLTGNMLHLAHHANPSTSPEAKAAETPDAMYAKAVEHLRGYVEALRGRGFDRRHLLLQHAGWFTDNGPPDDLICHLVERFNREQPLPGLRLTTATPSSFAKALRADLRGRQVQTVRGAWPDYWAHGLGSVPREAAWYREAQALLPLAARLRPDDPQLERARYHQLSAAEHTFGAFDSIWGWDGARAQEQWCRKRLHFIAAVDRARELVHDGLAAEARRSGAVTGEVAVLNPAELAQGGLIDLRLRLVDGKVPRLRDLVTGTLHELQVVSDPEPVVQDHDRNAAVRCQAVLPRLPGDALRRFALDGDSAETVCEAGASLDDGAIALSTRGAGGVEHLTVGGRELAATWDDRPFASLVRVERDAPWSRLANEHRDLALGRRHEDWLRAEATKAVPAETVAQVAGAPQRLRGPVFDALRLPLSQRGFSELELELRRYHALPRVLLAWRWRKLEDTRPYGDYALLPFAAAADCDLRLDTAGGSFAPHRGQVPGTCQDFYTVQGWLRLADRQGAIRVCPVDTPLWMVGGITQYAWTRGPFPRHDRLVANLMNNWWHTNFPRSQAGVGGSRIWLETGPAGRPGAAEDRFASACRLGLPAVAL